MAFLLDIHRDRGRDRDHVRAVTLECALQLAREQILVLHHQHAQPGERGHAAAPRASVCDTGSTIAQRTPSAVSA